MKKILLIEDDKHLGLILKDQLEYHGFQVDPLRFPKQTVDQLLTNDYDLVIMDKLLGAVDGINICREIRNTELVSQVPILMMSGFDDTAELCIQFGANNFIAKPFELDELIESINNTINEASKHEL